MANEGQRGIMPRPTFVFTQTITEKNAGTVCDYLATQTGLSKTRTKKALGSGAVWISTHQKKPRRMRRATRRLRPGEKISLYYDENILSETPEPATLVRDDHHYSVWFKPPGLMAQGGRYGDHCSLSYAIRHSFPLRKVYIVHRLDREASGLMLVAHSRRVASQFSALFRQREIEKTYQIWVRGNLPAKSPRGCIDLKLDGREALTIYETSHFEAAYNQTLVTVKIVTGRRHQIRRHFEGVGFPVMGDPVYGEGNKNKIGLRLIACELAFTCPIRKVAQHIELPQEQMMKWVTIGMENKTEV